MVLPSGRYKRRRRGEESEEKKEEAREAPEEEAGEEEGRLVQSVSAGLFFGTQKHGSLLTDRYCAYHS